MHDHDGFEQQQARISLQLPMTATIGGRYKVLAADGRTLRADVGAARCRLTPITWPWRNSITARLSILNGAAPVHDRAGPASSAARATW